jgi:hypothetical protein
VHASARSRSFLLSITITTRAVART